MILKALYDYYYRIGDLAPAGMTYKEIAFVIVIDKEGNFIRIEDRHIDKKTCQKFSVVKGMRTGSKPKPYLFWDNVEYVLNYTKFHPALDEEKALDVNKVKEREDKIEKAQIKHRALVEKYNAIAQQYPKNIGFKAVCSFYEKGGIHRVKEDPLWEKITKKPTVNISFLLDGELQIIAEDKDLQSLISEKEEKKDKSNLSICLITGEKAEAVKTTTPTPILGGQATGRLIAFQVNSGYDSYGKSKGLNAPISAAAADSYTTALNKLVDKDSHNKFIIGTRTFIFWGSTKSEASIEAEESIFSLLGYNESDADDPNRRIEQVRKTFKAIYSGTLNTNLEDRFYFLGLAPNSAREAVIYWDESELKEFAGRILQHFEDMEIVDTRKEKKPYFGLFQIMSAVSLEGKSSNIQPNLPEIVTKSIIEGIPYPYPLLLACINRIRAEQKITITRAAIIKAYLNRINDNTKKIEIMVDKENKNQGYLCGRLFATLEYLQERSSNINSIRGRYMNAASATPSAVFPTLLNLSVHHAEKLEKGMQIYFEQIKTEIIEKIVAEGFPTHLTLLDQGRFMVGYYHQRQFFYTKKIDKTINNTEQKN